MKKMKDYVVLMMRKIWMNIYKKNKKKQYAKCSIINIYNIFYVYVNLLIYIKFFKYINTLTLTFIFIQKHKI